MAPKFHVNVIIRLMFQILHLISFFFAFVSVLFFLFYLAFGASIFSAIESPIEKQEVQRLIDKKKDFLKEHPCITGTVSYNMELKLCLTMFSSGQYHQIFMNRFCPSRLTFLFAVGTYGIERIAF